MPAPLNQSVAPFRVEIALSIEPDGFLRQMRNARFSAMPREQAIHAPQNYVELHWVAPPFPIFDGSVLGDLADFAAICESHQAVLGFELPDETAGLQPLSYLCADEVSTDNKNRDYAERRESHSWTIYLNAEGSVVVVFHHGKFGMRTQTFPSMSSALYCLRDLVNGRSWEQFGDEDSQRTLLHKGQFYWDSSHDKPPIPVDNFVFETLDGHTFCVAGVGGQSVLSWEAPNGRTANAWHANHAESLDTLAEILSGDVRADTFHAEEAELPKDWTADSEFLSQEQRADHEALRSAKRWIPATVAPVSTPAEGTAYVLSIFKSNDKFAIHSLSYRTKQGHHVRLLMSDDFWSVTADGLTGQRAVTECTARGKAQAFRALAHALRGKAWD